MKFSERTIQRHREYVESAKRQLAAQTKLAAEHPAHPLVAGFVESARLRLEHAERELAYVTAA